MGQHHDALTRIGERLRSAQDEAPLDHPLDRDAGRERLLLAAARRRSADQSARAAASPRRWWLGASAGVAAAAAVAVTLLLTRPSGSLTFQVGDHFGGGEAGAVGAWLAAPPGQSLPLRFSDGTAIELRPEARARVARSDADGAEIVLERGHAHAEVVHRDKSRWDVDVGPFEVRVTGTRFDVSWDPVTEVFELVLEEGSVRIAGPLLGEGRPVVAGETVRVSVKEERLEITAGGRPRRSAAATATSEPQPGDPPAAASPAAPAPDAPAPVAANEGAPIDLDQIAPDPSAVANTAPARPRVRWRELAVAGRYDEALAAAEKLGFDDVCTIASAADLMLLGDTARLARNGARGSQALLALRERFPRDPRAAMAAFVQGKIAFDQRGAYGDAARWFEVYLREQPAGPVAREAAGRLIEARVKAGNASGARTAASQYLRAYPLGPHAELARRLLAASP
ncbi:MAG: FecR domain-containing protein [Polyangiaceae bacterium]